MYFRFYEFDIRNGDDAAVRGTWGVDVKSPTQWSWELGTSTPSVTVWLVIIIVRSAALWKHPASSCGTSWTTLLNLHLSPCQQDHVCKTNTKTGAHKTHGRDLTGHCGCISTTEPT